MSTSGLYGFQHKGELYLNYNHWDSDPNWLGRAVTSFCRFVQGTPNGWRLLQDRVDSLVLVEENDIPTPAQAKDVRFWTDKGVSNGVNWYSALRRGQDGKNLSAIFDGSLIYMCDYKDFFGVTGCQYTYIINLDHLTLEFYHRGDLLQVFNLDEDEIVVDNWVQTMRYSE